MANYIKYKGSLANRTAAAAERSRVETLAAKNEQVVLDYSDVKSLSSSYADELFGVFVQRHGSQSLKTTLKVKSANPDVARAIGLAIQYRMPVSAA